ncbi:DUF456 domain-containing protein [Myxacorys almedinensis]|uniref:DUF456 family protein n=1 Tax=Myxacorys almedinensis A TaxID=2690445 RepID=A0A8J8CL18_9CYAN|nr:DUF456 family protein [Myxacorys almedinensis]NDJ17240.1 DUF456 family protein [Myxacorys almedinensis A]
MIALYWALVAVMVVGIVGAIVPGIPGIGLILAAVVVWGFVKGFAAVSVALPVAIAVFVVSIGVDFLATYWGAKKAGASHWGQIGAIVGFVLGFLGFLPTVPIGGPIGIIIGILLGPLLGAIVGEFLYRKDLLLAVKAGMGIVVGSVLGNLLQAIFAIATVGIFLYTTVPTATGS